ncbi:MAG TPA: DUF748 domain-containing protein, partial [Nevskiaceae bacterium]|nr:DUF748 domain-containing protein [Nevskiaceae bacterium]
ALKAPGAPKTEEAPKAAAPSKQDGAASPMRVQVKTFHVERSELAFADRSIQPNFSASIFDLGGDVRGLSTGPAARAKIQLAGKVDAFSPVLIGGEIVPSAYDRHTDVTLSFRNMDLVRFNPYSGKFAGYDIVKGKLTTDLHYTIRDRALTAEHHVVLDQLEFGDATGSKDAVPLPVKLAVALLKDRNGVIDLQLPINGSLDDPGFRVAPVIGKVLLNTLTKAVTAPFTLLAGLLGGGGEEISWVDFAPGRADLRDSESGKLAKLSQALAERPQLKLDIPLALAGAPDGEALAREALAQRVPATAERERLKALARTYEEVLGNEPDWPQDIDEPAARIAWLEASVVPKLVPDAAALRRLADERARAVQAALLASPDIAPERIFLTGAASQDVSEAGDVRMKLAIKP